MVEDVTSCCCPKTLICSLMLLFEAGNTEWMRFLGVNQKYLRLDEVWCRGDHEMALWDCFFTSFMWFICWFNRSHWSSCVTTTNLSQSFSDLSIINRIAVLQWHINFSMLFIWEPKSMLFISYICSARPTKMKKNVNKLITDKGIDVSYF